MPDPRQRRRSALGDPEQRRDQIVGPSASKPGCSPGAGHAHQNAGPLAVEIEAGGEVDRHREPRAAASGIGSVNRTCRRSGVTGRSTPAISPSARDHAPAAHRPSRSRSSLLLVTTARISPPSTTIARAPRSRSPGGPPCARAPAAYPWTTESGVAWPSDGENAPRKHVVDLGAAGTAPAPRPRSTISARHTEPALERHAALKRVDVLLAREHEQVPDPVQVDLPPWPPAELGERAPGCAARAGC